MAKTFLPYLTLSIYETPVILGTSQAPYPTERLICFAFGHYEQHKQQRHGMIRAAFAFIGWLRAIATA
jgi:hypothetical protein